MPNDALLLILLSAVMHAGWNLILKTSRHKLAFNVFMHGSAIVGVLGGIFLFRERFGRIRLIGAALIALGVFCIKLG